MTAIASTDVTVTLSTRMRIGRELQVTGTLVFGTGALTYPSGGVPLPAKATYFRLNSINRMHLLGGEGIGYVYKYDKTNHKIRMYQTATLTPAGTVAAPAFTGSALGTHTHDIKIIGGISTIDEPVGVEGTDTLGKDAATDRTIAGSASATKGGVVAITAGTPAGTNSAPAFTGAATTAAALAECGTGVAPASVTLYFEAWGN